MRSHNLHGRTHILSRTKSICCAPPVPCNHCEGVFLYVPITASVIVLEFQLGQGGEKLGCDRRFRPVLRRRVGLEYKLLVFPIFEYIYITPYTHYIYLIFLSKTMIIQLNTLESNLTHPCQNANFSIVGTRYNLIQCLNCLSLQCILPLFQNIITF